MTHTRRVYIDAERPYPMGPISATFEITRVPGDDERPDPIGRPRCSDWDGYEYSAEVISHDTEHDYDLEELEVMAIEQAQREWASERTATKGAA